MLRAPVGASRQGKLERQDDRRKKERRGSAGGEGGGRVWREQKERGEERRSCEWQKRNERRKKDDERRCQRRKESKQEGVRRGEEGGERGGACGLSAGTSVFCIRVVAGVEAVVNLGDMAEGVVQRTGSSRRELDGGVPGVGNLYVKVVPPPDLNKNTEWFLYPGVWTTYLLIIVIGWLLILSVFRCSAGTAWTVVNLTHFAVTYRFFHWKKGSPFAEDQGMYNKLTWWEQVDHGRQLTRNRKFLTVVPVVLYLIASHTTDYRSPVLLLNTIAVFVLLIAKFPHMHKVRIFGINSDYPT